MASAQLPSNKRKGVQANIFHHLLENIAYHKEEESYSQFTLFVGFCLSNCFSLELKQLFLMKILLSGVAQLRTILTSVARKYYLYLLVHAHILKISSQLEAP